MFARERLQKALRPRKRRRKSMRVLPREAPPSAVPYLQLLLPELRALEAEIRLALAPLLQAASTRLDATDDDVIAEARVALRALYNRRSAALPIAQRAVANVERTNRAAMNAQFRVLAKVDVFSEDPTLASVLQKALRRNVQLIQGLSQRTLDDIEVHVFDAFRRGDRIEGLAEVLQQRFSVAASRARFIARDQVAKLNGELVKARQQALGIETYVWSTSKDERVRGNPHAPKSASDHYHLEGTVQKWSKPPIVDESDGQRCHPGEDYQCRCIALPRVDDILDALGVSEV